MPMDALNFPASDHAPGQRKTIHSSAESAQAKIHKCHVCNKTYERRDHLSRHIKSHSEDRSHVCSDCGKGFHRGDLLTRHRAVHLKDTSVDAQRRRTSKACQSCITAKTKCNDERPCARCNARGEPCMPTQSRVRVLDKGNSSLNLSPNIELNLDQPNGINGSSSTTPGTQHDAGLLAFANPSFVDPAVAFEQLQFPDFFDQIMNMPAIDAYSIQEPLLAPPNVSTFASDDFSIADFDFGQLAGGFTRPSTAQGMRHPTDASDAMQTSPRSDAQLRSEAFERSPWGWNRWIPDKSHTTFSGQEINVTDQRVSSDDHLTPSDGPRFFLALEQEARDRILRMVTSTAASRLAIASFPSLELLNDLLHVFVLQERHSVESYVHWPSIDCRKMRTETLLGILAKGATFVALQPVWRIGLVFQEIVRLAVAETFETDNSTTRQLQPLQAYMLYLDVGLWSGIRRKTEIASSFLQPGATMLSWADAFMKFRYDDIVPSNEDDARANQTKWKTWIEQESLKRIVLHTFIHDSQASLAHTRDPLLSPSRMQLPLPASIELWRAPDAESWRACYLSTDCVRQSQLPSVVSIAGDIQTLRNYGRSVDQRLCTLLACHLIAYEVLQYRQQAAVLASGAGCTRRDRWLAHTNRQKEIYEDLNAMHTYCDMLRDPIPEAAFILHYLMMLLHTSFDDIQLFSGRSGETEARRVYPLIKAWTDEAESRTAVWHAGQALKTARSFEATKLRDFYAVIFHHTGLTLWVYGMVTSNLARISRSHTPAREPILQLNEASNGDRAGHVEDVILDGEDDRRARAFRHFGQGRPCLTRPGAAFTHFGVGIGSAPLAVEICPIEHPKSIMLLASQVLEDNFPNSGNGLPPLVGNLVKLMNELSRFSGKDPG